MLDRVDTPDLVVRVSHRWLTLPATFSYASSTGLRRRSPTSALGSGAFEPKRHLVSKIIG